MKYEPMTWYGWNGGECPVHPNTLVDYITNIVGKGEKKKAGQLDWSHAGLGDIVAFRVVKEHKEPRELWVDKQDGQVVYENPNDPTFWTYYREVTEEE